MTTKLSGEYEFTNKRPYVNLNILSRKVLARHILPLLCE